MSFDFDTGNAGGEGPWIAWTARGTQDGAVAAKSFYLRDGDGKTPIVAFQTGVVMDIETMKTGWQRSDGIIGQAPEWRWNESVRSFRPAPGDDWKKGLSIRCAIGADQAATWEQAGAAAWNAFAAMAPALREQPAPGMLPVVRLTGTKAVQFKRGSTVEPVLEVVKWVPRPDVLKDGAAAGVAVTPAPAVPAPVPAPAPQQVAAPAGAPW